MDFTSLFGGYTAGSYDQLNFNGLTVTSRTSVGDSITNVADPWGANPPKRNGVPGDVYWGLLGNLGVTGQSYFGLGVLTNGQTPTDSTTGPITYSETLRFHFDTPQIGQGAGREVAFTALGLQSNANGTNTNTPVPTDNMRVWVKVASGETSFTDINAYAVTLFGPDYGSAIDYILRYSSFSNELVTDFAVEEIWGSQTNLTRQFGIGSVTYNAVPEPATMLLLGSGLAGIAAFRRKFKK